MRIGEKLKGAKLKGNINDGDLIAKDDKVHIVFDYTICRPSMIDQTERRRERVWEKVGDCNDFYKYREVVDKIGLIYCKSCYKKLHKNGY
jgi:hypothetical protein